MEHVGKYKACFSRCCVEDTGHQLAHGSVMDAAASFKEDSGQHQLASRHQIFSLQLLFFAGSATFTAVRALPATFSAASMLLPATLSAAGVLRSHFLSGLSHAEHSLSAPLVLPLVSSHPLP